MTTFDLSAAVAAYRAEQARLAAERDADLRLRATRAEAERVTLFRAWLEATFSTELLQGLGATVHARDTLMSDSPTLRWTFDGVDFWATQSAVGQFYVEVVGYSHLWAKASDDASLIGALATLHTLAVERRALQAAQDARRAAALAVHARCQATVAAAQAAAPRFVWPDGCELTIVHWRWCTAPAGPDAGAEYAYGYSLQEAIGPDGLLILQPTRGDVRPRSLCLSAAVLPIAELLPVRSDLQLPPELTEAHMIAVPGIRPDYEQWDDAGDPLLVEDPEGELLADLGQRPVAWIRAALGR